MKKIYSFAKSTVLRGSASIALTVAALITANSGMAQNTYTFTTCGSTGQTGPSQTQVTSGYTNTTLQGQVTTTGGIQYWTVPANASNIRIEVFGAQGGTSGSNAGGLGARMRGDFTVTPGSVLKIVVGQQGVAGSNQGGGGGGTYVCYSNNTPLIIAGGGGGSYYSTYSALSGQMNGTVSGTANYGVYGYNSTSYGVGGSAGGGGTVGTSFSTAQGAGGGGLIGNGQNGSTSGAYGGTSFVNGSGGGSPAGSPAGGGGFGGGGGADWSSYTGGGGGGGYSGGSGGTYYGCGGGGGSYNVGAAQSNSSGVNSGNGRVIITELCNITMNTSISNTNNAICAGQSVTLTTNAVSGYSWSTGATTSSIVVSPTATTIYSLVGTSSLACQAAALQTINVSSQIPNISVVNTASTNNGVCPNGTVMLTASTATSSGLTNISWNNGISNGVAFSLTGGGVYSVTATNACGSSVSAISLSVLPTPTISVAVSVNTLCSGTSLTTTATGANTYAWSHGFNNNQGFFPSTTANYSVVGTAVNGCTAQAVTSQVTVVLTPTAFPTAAPPLICIGNSSTLTATGATTYTWITQSGTNNNAQIVVSPTATATYTIIKLNANCSDTKTVTVIVNNLPAVAALVNPSVSCASKPVTLTAIGTGTTYTWSPSAPSGTGAGSVIVTPTANTVYTLTVSDGTCVNNTTNSVQVNPNPTITVARSSTAICVGQSATLTLGGGINYTWTAPASASLTGSVVVVTPTSNTSYQLIGDNAFSCTTAAQSVIIVNNNPTITTSANPTLICVAGTSTIGASGANAYSWNTSAQTASTPVNALSTTVYTVTGTYTATGCNSSKTVQVAVFEPTFGVSGSFSSCVGGTITLTGTGALSYTWNGNYPFQVFTASPPGPTVYMVTAQSMSNNVYCNSTQSVNIAIYQNPTITAAPQRTLICNGESVDLFGGGGATYIWTGTQLGGSLQGGTVNVSPTKQATYTAVGTDSNGCVGTATTVVKVSSCQGITEAEVEGIRVYPNPSNGNFTIEANKNMTLQVTNELGQLVRVVSVDALSGGKVNIEGLAPGLYFIVANVDGKTLHQKVLIE
jgi:hypothetical protein